ncbi:MAG: AIM24 family protein [Lachnospiraceae bacterium]|jgi:uncharacterized protein (AIM24 family)|nr:AIM24 family protein [Lachnospiraceae bacterium]MCI1328290.1 AIM24 family protein [Lachnospiraceae bacterium]
MQILDLENKNHRYVDSMDNFHVLEYQKDYSVAPDNAMIEYFMSQMNIRRRQLIIDMDGKNTAIIQAGAMQWMAGNVKVTSGIKGVGDLFGKAMKGALVKESAAKPEYAGSGLLALEPTYKYILLEHIENWNQGMTIEDGMFYACSGTVKNKIVHRKNVSSSFLGGEGFFNLSLYGEGIVALESNVPREELITVDLDNDELKIDGNLALAWSSNLEFTVEKTTKTIAGSAISGEGLVNVYRGTGRVIMCPVAPTSSLLASTQTMSAKAAAKNSNTLGK